MTKKDAKQWLTDTVNDVFMNMCYYDRKEDEVMNVKQLRDLMDEGIISKEIMIEVFTKQIGTEYPDEP